MATIALVVALVLWVWSTVMAWVLFRAIQLRLTMARWPRHRGVVRAHKVRSSRNLHGPGHHRPIVVVDYVVDDRKRVAHCDSPTRLGYGQMRHARSTAERFPLGSSIDVYVDPSNPKRVFAYLPEMASIVMLSLGSLFLFVVGLGIINGLDHYA